jgi:hypothetical protein
MYIPLQCIPPEIRCKITIHNTASAIFASATEIATAFAIAGKVHIIIS